jgi:PEP-CTERM motif
VDPTVSYAQVPGGFISVGQSFAQLNSWLDFLTTAPAVNGTTVFENSASRLLVKSGPTGAPQQYETVLGLGTDQIANTTLVPTAITIGASGYSVGLYQVTKNASGFSDVVQLFTLVGNSDTGKLTFVPEPGSLLLLGAGIAGLAAFGKRRAA